LLRLAEELLDRMLDGEDRRSATDAAAGTRSSQRCRVATSVHEAI
jgi:hypothetical protein